MRRFDRLLTLRRRKKDDEPTPICDWIQVLAPSFSSNQRHTKESARGRLEEVDAVHGTVALHRTSQGCHELT